MSRAPGPLRHPKSLQGSPVQHVGCMAWIMDTHPNSNATTNAKTKKSRWTESKISNSRVYRRFREARDDGYSSLE